MLSHVCQRYGVEGIALFEELYSTSYVIGAQVNDIASTAYPQAHPKDRVIAYLEAIIRGDEMTTPQSMEREYLLGCKSEEGVPT